MSWREQSLYLSQELDWVRARVREHHEKNHQGPWRWCSDALCDQVRRRFEPVFSSASRPQ